MYLAYSLLTLAVFVVVSPYFLYQAIRYKKYIGSLRQRLGYLPISFNVDGEESIWIHAVSVGEALTARALAGDLKARYPRLRLFLSTTTIAGQHVARQSLQHVDPCRTGRGDERRDHRGRNEDRCGDDAWQHPGHSHALQRGGGHPGQPIAEHGAGRDADGNDDEAFP